MVRALIKLQNFPSHYLYVYRASIPPVIEQLDKTREAKAEYDQLLEQRTGVQVTFALMYAGVSLIFLLAAIWLGLWFSDRLVAPIVRLLDAARRVSGAISMPRSAVEGPGDLETLARTFNRMTDPAQEQRNELLTTNHQLDERRRFTEAMLAGVSAGVIGLDPDRTHIARQPFRPQLVGAAGSRTCSASPSSDALAGLSLRSSNRQCRAPPVGRRPGHMRVGGRERSFVVRVTTEVADECRARLCPHLRRHHRTCFGPAQLRLGRHRPAHCP